MCLISRSRALYCSAVLPKELVSAKTSNLSLCTHNREMTQTAGEAAQTGLRGPPLFPWRIPSRKGAVLSLGSVVGMNQTMHTPANVDQ